MSQETTTETPTTPTEGTPSSEAAATTLLSSTEAAASTTATASDPAKPAAAAADAPAAAEEAKPAAETKPEGAPEKYEFTAPEGKQYDSAVLEPFSAAAKVAGLTQDAAQKLLDTMAPALAERQSDQVKAVQTGWLEASKSDKEFGGEKLPANLAIAKKAADTFATPELRTLLDQSGLGNHPEVLRMFIKVGQSLKEDSFVTGSGSTKGAQDLAAKLYPNTPSKG